ncbi:hypothetical protein G7Z17_g4682 [Cylindrodendrum hubeiense]|uniref:Carbonic anhydrase n=1 Tax=Cylindrodendrum hubeiense TaxID=595255 RepID=A0A9P5L9R1_9HYPO|nr:hypothetical protein G7Z17_g4682 [Cylindrodendrum hubeiense]
MASQTSNQENLVAKNALYTANFTEGHLALPPAKKYAVGGNAVDALRSLVISQQLLGTAEIILVKHTGCGMLIFDTPTATGLVEKNLGAEGIKELERFVGGSGNFQTFSDLETAVKSDVKLLKDSSLFAEEIVISGWIYEVETGKTRQVL